jgi:hypothetical protein
MIKQLKLGLREVDRSFRVGGHGETAETGKYSMAESGKHRESSLLETDFLQVTVY